MQLLPPKQRVAVVLRDVLDWSAREVADLLDDSVPAVNSALRRGRDRLQRERHEGKLAREHMPENAAEEERVMQRFEEAWAAVDHNPYPGVRRSGTRHSLSAFAPASFSVLVLEPPAAFIDLWRSCDNDACQVSPGRRST